MKSIRVQRKRTKGWRMPANTKCVTRPGKWGNPFQVGKWMMVGDPDAKARFQMSWCRAATAEIAARTPGKFTLISSAAMAVEFFDRLCATGYFRHNIGELRGFNLACYCKPGDPCHADVLLRIANE